MSDVIKQIKLGRVNSGNF